VPGDPGQVERLHRRVVAGCENDGAALASAPMTLQTIARNAVLLALACALCACSTAAKHAPRPAVRTIAVIPAVDPDWYSLRNANLLGHLSGIADLAFAQDSRVKARAFTEKLIGLTPPLGAELTKSVVDGLNRQGFVATVVPTADLVGQDLRDIDYEKIKTPADAVLHVYFTDVGVYSGLTSVHYLPRTNIYGYLFSPKDAGYIHEETVYYGADGREGKTWSVPADPSFAYRSFEDLQGKVAEVASGFAQGTREAAQRMAENFGRALR
jgi:hypothetical protein